MCIEYETDDMNRQRDWMMRLDYGVSTDHADIVRQQSTSSTFEVLP